MSEIQETNNLSPKPFTATTALGKYSVVLSCKLKMLINCPFLFI